MPKKAALGKGLDALLGGRKTVKPAPLESVEEAAKKPHGELHDLALELIQPGQYQPRTDMNAEKLGELAESIKAQGVVQPILVRPVGAGKYEIIAGERRWRAAQLAELDVIPAVVRDVPDQQTMAMALIENIQRENLNPLEESGALQRLIREFELTHSEAASAVGRSRAAVSNLLRLQELDAEVKSLVESRQLDMGHARALLALTGSKQRRAALEVVAKGLSVRATEALVKRLQSGAAEHASKKPTEVDPDIVKLQDDLGEKLAARVMVKHSSSGRGQLVINYNNLDELDGILAHIK